MEKGSGYKETILLRRYLVFEKELIIHSLSTSVLAVFPAKCSDTREQEQLKGPSRSRFFFLLTSEEHKAATGKEVHAQMAPLTGSGVM